MTAPDPTAGERHGEWVAPTGSLWGYGHDTPASPPAVAASTGTSEDEEALLDCECGHSLDEHNGLGCYARLSYEPLVQCSCALTDDRTHGELLAPRLATLLAAREAAARAEGAAAVRDDIRARRREFRRLNADQEYLNALDDAYGLAANHARGAR